MISKAKILKFIQKYNLDANASGRPDNAIKLVSDGNKLTTSFVTEDKSLLGFVQVTDAEFPAGEFGIYETTKLENMIKILQNEFSITEEELNGKVTNLNLHDDQYNITFVLSDIAVIPVPPKPKEIPQGDFDIPIDGIFIDRYNKAKKALSESDVIAFVNKGGKVQLVVNHSSNNTNNIKLDLGIDAPAGFEKIIFDGNQFLDILNSNKDAVEGTVGISLKGLMIANFTGEDYKARYYLVAGQQ